MLSIIVPQWTHSVSFSAGRIHWASRGGQLFRFSSFVSQLTQRVTKSVNECCKEFTKKENVFWPKRVCKIRIFANELQKLIKLNEWKMRTYFFGHFSLKMEMKRLLREQNECKWRKEERNEWLRIGSLISPVKTLTLDTILHILLLIANRNLFALKLFLFFFCFICLWLQSREMFWLLVTRGEQFAKRHA